jgi:hypothetical protein
MSKQVLTYIILLSFLNFHLTCTTIKTSDPNEAVETYPSFRIKATKFQEVRLTTVDNKVQTGMLLSLEEDRLLLSPVPYWNVDLIEIDLDKIRAIKLMKNGGEGGKGFIWGFTLGFMAIGGIALASGSLKYDEDYSEALTFSSLGAAGVGLLGLIIGGLASLGKKSNYDFIKMSKKEKILALQEIMLE